MNSYNRHLLKLRENKGLSIKEAAKGAHIPAISLFFYEKGYYRPGKKALKKLSAFYGEKISTRGINAYPAPTNDLKKPKKESKKPLLIKRIVFLSLTLLSLASSLTGASLFSRAMNNDGSSYGETYSSLKKAIEKDGEIGHDMVTSLEYYGKSLDDGSKTATIIYYKTNNLLFFNECDFSSLALDLKTGITRYHIKFGGNLGVSSNYCEATLVNLTHGTFVTFNFFYDGNPIKEVFNYNVRVKGDEDVSQETMIGYIQEGLPESNELFSELISLELGSQHSFIDDFLPAREKGRVKNFNMQVASLILLFVGVITFFAFLAVFLWLMLKNIKPRLYLTDSENTRKDLASLPKDINVRIGLPDFSIFAFSMLLVATSLILMALGLIGKLGILSLPDFFSNQAFSSFTQMALLSGVFLGQFTNLIRLKKPEAVIKTIIFDLLLFLSIASLETIVIAITDAWGYEVTSLIYNYVPSNIYGVVAVHYLIYLLLFFHPKFVANGKKAIRVLWHSLSLIPLAYLVLTYFLGNAYALKYGAQENIFLNFWFPNGFLPLSIVSIAFIYTVFFLRLFIERKYGKKNAHVYFHGDRYNMIENCICILFIVIVGALDFFFAKNQYALYLGLGNNHWIFTLIPFILLTKCSPNSQEMLGIDVVDPSPLLK